AVSAIQPGPHVDGAAPLVTRLLEMEEADAAFALAEMEGTLYVIGRGRCASVDVGGLIRELGGGGHPRAASARLKDASAREVKARLIELLERHVTPEPTAREIMAYPVRTILPDVSVAEARRRMIRYGHSGLAVAEGGRLVGVVTRRDADKARHHRLEHAPVRGFMTAHVHTVGPDTPLSEIERVMIAEGVGRLPVLRDGALIGIVTRSDVLKAQYGARYLAGKPTGIEEPVAQLLKERLPATVQRLLDEVGLAAAREDCQAYVVGGFVRDLILGERNLDVDILVEPDGAALARGFAAACGGVFKNIERFGTAKVTLLDGFDVDFATARTEAYAQPGALPEVEPSSITDDLRRRDFAFNALALALRPERFGELLDPFGGREDLQLRRVRVLHNLSFIEDPTRIFRAARFEERFHFKMTPQTEMLAREAVETDALGTIKPERRRQELYRTFREPRLFAALLRLQDLGVLRWMHEELVLDEALWHAVPRALEWWKGHGGSAVDRKLVFLGALLTPLGAESAAETAGRQLRVPPPDLKRMASALWAMEAADELLPPDADAAAVTRLLQPLAPETLVLLRACATSRSQEGDTALSLLDRFVAEWRNVRLEITGEDLMALGYSAGPRIGEALRRTLDARLRGEISGRDEELAYARRLLDANGGGAAPPTG
ncbi:MAG TPA: CBS domain-containing protein, partial [Armatimonadota bacterium]|nr:CBS domain-containing protein [Armatimonadota bacterium]